MSLVIDASSLAKNFGPQRAVDCIDFAVNRGECFGILGPNGAGKTTTIRLLYGFTPKSSGSLRLFGLDIDSARREVKSRIGVCPQENNLDPDLTVRQNLELFARYFNLGAAEAHQRAGELLQFVALEHRQHARVSELSGGMQRRLVLARALVNQPELLILDEPTTGLDPQSRHQLWNRIESLKARGLTVLLTTHYMEEAARLCDRLLIMDQGRILVEGEPAALVQQHLGREIIEVPAPSNALRDYLRQHALSFEDLGERLIVYHTDGAESYRTLTRDFCQGGCILRPATLEDLFLRLTGRELRD